MRKLDSQKVYAMKVMRKERILERDHGDYVRAERDVLTAVFHPYIVTLRFSFQARLAECRRAKKCLPVQCIAVSSGRDCMGEALRTTVSCAGACQLLQHIVSTAACCAFCLCAQFSAAGRGKLI